MAYQLWSSPITGYRRRGTRMSDLHQLFEDHVTADSIQEPLRCCLYEDSAIAVKSELLRLDFDVAGLQAGKHQPALEFVRAATLADGVCQNYAEPIRASDIISESTPLIEVLFALKFKTYCFIQNGTQISGIVTRADLQKPAVRILVFGIVSLLEMHLSFLVKRYFPLEKWKTVLSSERIAKAETLLGQRKDRNEVLDLVDCLQFADKRDLLLLSGEMRDHFGLHTNQEAKELLNGVQTLRDKLAHSQDIVLGTTWEEIIDNVSKAEAALLQSDEKIENECHASAEMKAGE